MPRTVIGDDIVCATGHSRTKLDGIRGFERVFGPKIDHMVCNVYVEGKETDIFRIGEIVTILANQFFPLPSAQDGWSIRYR